MGSRKQRIQEIMSDDSHHDYKIARTFLMEITHGHGSSSLVCSTQATSVKYSCPSTQVSVIVLIVIQELQTRQKLSIIGRKTSSGLSDVAINRNGDSRFVQWLIPGCKTIIASFFSIFLLTCSFCRVFSPDTLGTVHVWDRRAGVSPCIELSTNRYDSLKSIQIHVDNQVIIKPQ